MDDDGGMQYWQQLGQYEEQEFFNLVMKTEEENVGNGQPAPESRELKGEYHGICGAR